MSWKSDRHETLASRMTKMYFGRVKLVLHDYEHDDIKYTRNTQAFSHPDMLARDLVKSGHLACLLERDASFYQNRDRTIDQYADDLEYLEKMEDKTGIPKEKLDFLTGASPRPSDYQSWTGYLTKYSIIPIQTVGDLERFLSVAERGPYMITIELEMHELDVGNETTIGTLPADPKQYVCYDF